MSRTIIRTAQLSLDTIGPALSLFGTIQNAYDRLGLSQLGLTYSVFYRAMHFRSITPDHKDLIEDSWKRWRQLFLHPKLPVAQDLSVSADNRHNAVSWSRNASV